jgi:hypothetical protein
MVQNAIDVFKLLMLLWQLFYSRLMGTLGEKATTVIFANIEDILLTNTVLPPHPSLLAMTNSLVDIPFCSRRTSERLSTLYRPHWRCSGGSHS